MRLLTLLPPNIRGIYGSDMVTCGADGDSPKHVQSVILYKKDHSQSDEAVPTFLDGATWTQNKGECHIGKGLASDKKSKGDSTDKRYKVDLIASHEQSSTESKDVAGWWVKQVKNFQQVRKDNSDNKDKGQSWTACQKNNPKDDPKDLSFAFCGAFDHKGVFYDACFAQGSRSNWYVASPHFDSACTKPVKDGYHFNVFNPNGRAATPNESPSGTPDPHDTTPDDDDNDDDGDDRFSLPSWITSGGGLIAMVIIGGCLLVFVMKSKATANAALY